MIESFLYGTLICGQTLYWFLLKYQTELREEECWRMLCVLTCTASGTPIVSTAFIAPSRLPEFRTDDN
jgi:hypothetical protein